jgi:1-acyl-sn-glycerol-3-phosphate acyltransferase
LWSVITVNRLCSIGFNGGENEHYRGLRKKIFQWFVYFYSKTALFMYGIFVNFQEVEFDYSEYLGPNYKDQEDSTVRATTLVSNHISSIDILIFLSHRLQPGFVAKAEVRKAPMVGEISH